MDEISHYHYHHHYTRTGSRVPQSYCCGRRVLVAIFYQKFRSASGYHHRAFYRSIRHISPVRLVLCLNRYSFYLCLHFTHKVRFTSSTITGAEKWKGLLAEIDSFTKSNCPGNFCFCSKDDPGNDTYVATKMHVRYKCRVLLTNFHGNGIITRK